MLTIFEDKAETNPSSFFSKKVPLGVNPAKITSAAILGKRLSSAWGGSSKMPNRSAFPRISLPSSIKKNCNKKEWFYRVKSFHKCKQSCSITNK